MTKISTIAILALTTTLLAAGNAFALAPIGDVGDEAGFGGGGGGGGGVWPAQSSQIDEPGAPFYPNGAPQRGDFDCERAGGELIVHIEDGRTYRVCIL